MTSCDLEVEKPVLLLRTYRFVEGPMNLYEFELPQIEQWYMIMRRPSNNDGPPKLIETFKNLSFPPDHPVYCLGTSCALVGSFLYVIGGDTRPDGYKAAGTNAVRRLDTVNPEGGWTSCHPLPFNYAYSGACVSASKFIHLYPGLHPFVQNRSRDVPWGYVYDTSTSSSDKIHFSRACRCCWQCEESSSLSRLSEKEIQPMFCTPLNNRDPPCVLIALASRDHFYLHYPNDPRLVHCYDCNSVPAEFQIQHPHTVVNGILNFCHQDAADNDNDYWYLSAYDIIPSSSCFYPFKVQIPAKFEGLDDKRNLFIVHIAGNKKFAFAWIRKSRNNMEPNFLHYIAIEVLFVHPSPVARVLEEANFEIWGRYIVDCLPFDSSHQEDEREGTVVSS